MPAFIVSALVGIVCIVLGVSNMKGNISSLHSYHRNRVSEEDRILFVRMDGGDFMMYFHMDAESGVEAFRSLEGQIIRVFDHTTDIVRQTAVGIGNIT